MGAPLAVRTTSRPADPADGGDAAGLFTPAGPPGTVSELLEGFGPLVAKVTQRDRDSAELGAARRDARQKFLDDFAAACETQVKPAMQAVVEQLRQLGGGGLVEEHPGGEARFVSPRIALWMSLEGEVGEPRLDRYPYLLLEADVEGLKVQVDEGDMWRGAGGNCSGRVGEWEVPELTGERVVRELLAIARRATR